MFDPDLLFPKVFPMQRLDLVAELTDYFAGFISENKKNLFQQAAAERTRHVTVVMEDIADPHDASAVIRSCECYGVQDFHVITRRRKFTVAPGVAVGASKWVDLYKHAEQDDASPCLTELKKAGYRVVGLSTRPDAIPLDAVDLDQKTALVFGSEDLGLSDCVHASLDATATLPVLGMGRKFNLSVAAALCLYTISARLRATNIPWRLTEAQRTVLLLSWYAKIPKRRHYLTERFLNDRGLSWTDLTACLPENVSTILQHNGRWR
nr:RNA methyltransferase [Acanthopleuribacter pedis]